jgi:adenosine kinase
MKNNKEEILIVGSVVRDIVRLSNGEKKEFYGGTGGNIAYGLGMLGLAPSLFSVVGRDFKPGYSKHLVKHGVGLKVYIDKKDKTAVFYIGKDQEGIHSESWEPNVFNKIEKLSLNKKFSTKDFQEIRIAIFSPGTPKSTEKHMTEFHQKKKNAMVIFDPGQMIERYTKKQMAKCIKLSDVLILNEFEFAEAEKILKKDPLKLLQNKILIKTLGNKGSVIYANGEIIFVKMVKPKKIVNALGAGDAYRAGLIFGLLNNMAIEKACFFGAKMASKNIEFLGCQEYFLKI